MKTTYLTPLAAGIVSALFALSVHATEAAKDKSAMNPNDTTLTAEEHAASATDTAPTLSGGSTHGKSDAHFVQMIASGGMAEVKLGELAKAKGQAADVKAFGEKMVTDHTRKNAELAAIAKGKGLQVPAAPLPEDQIVIDRLSKLSGEEFDKAYKREMVDSHARMERLLTETTEKATDADIKAYAKDTLMPVREHEQHAQMLNEGKQRGDSVAKSDMEDDDAVDETE